MQHETSQFLIPAHAPFQHLESLHTNAICTSEIVKNLAPVAEIGAKKLDEITQPTEIDIRQVIQYIEKNGQNWKNVREAAFHLIQRHTPTGTTLDRDQYLASIDVSAVLPFILGQLVKEASSTTLGWWNTLPFTPNWIELDPLAEMMRNVDLSHPSFCFIDVRPYHEHKLKRIVGSLNVAPRYSNQFCAQDQQIHEWNEYNPTNTTAWLFESCTHLKNVVLYDNYGSNMTALRRTAAVISLLLPNTNILCLAGGLRRFEERFFPLVFNLHSIRTPSFLLTLCEMSEYHFTPPIYGMSQILPNLFLGDEDDAQNIEALKANGITHVLCVADDSIRTPVGLGIKCLAFAVSENVLQSNISFHLHEALSFIEEGRKEGKILVHCRAGVNRSATVILSYLMKSMGWSLLKALTVVKQGRPIIRPMGQFIQLLMTMEREIFGENSIDNWGFVTLLSWTYIRQNLIELSPASQS